MMSAYTMLLALFFATATAQVRAVDSCWRDDIKTVTLYSNGMSIWEREPVLSLNDASHRMNLEFDILSEEPEALRWSIRHCDANWQVDDLEPYEFIEGFEYGAIERYDFSFTTLTPYIHYSQTVPMRDAHFIYSGNYILIVSQEDNEDSILLTRRFRVTEQCVKVMAEMPLMPYDGMATDSRQEVDVSVEALPSTMGVVLNEQYLKVLVQQNNRLDNMRELRFSGYKGAALSYANRPENVFWGGNAFRFFDLSNIRTPMYNVQQVMRYGGETFAIITPCENRSKRHYSVDANLNGGFKINIFDRNNPTLEADYVWVNLSLPAEEPMLGGSVHVVGALTDWRLDDASRMEYNPEYKAYTKRLLLKQGYYAYELLYLPTRSTEGETAQIEGDHHETPNNYNISVYYHSPAERSDRLLGVLTIENNR